MEKTGIAKNLPVGFSDIGTPSEVETVFLASFLNKPALVARYQHITPEMIHDPVISRLWEIALKVAKEALSGNGDIVGAMLSNDGQLARALTTENKHFRQTVADLSVLAVPDSDIETYAAVIIDRWKRRQALIVSQDFQNSLREIEDVEPADEVLQRTADRIVALQASVGASKEIDVEDLCEQIEADSEPTPKISTGYPRLDKAMGGGLIVPGMTVFEARPKSFKTGVMGSIAYRLAQRGERSAFITMEMPARQILLRMIAAEETGNVRNYEKYPDRMRRSAAFFRQKYPGLIRFYDMHGAAFSSIQSTLWAIAAAGIRVVFLDYFQLIRGCPKDQAKLDFMEDMAGWFQGFTNQTQMAMVVAAQVGRSGETYGSDALNRNASFVGQIRDAAEHSERMNERRLWLDSRFIRHGELHDIGSDSYGPMTISDVGPMLDIEED